MARKKLTYGTRRMLMFMRLVKLYCGSQPLRAGNACWKKAKVETNRRLPPRKRRKGK